MGATKCLSKAFWKSVHSPGGFGKRNLKLPYDLITKCCSYCLTVWKPLNTASRVYRKIGKNLNLFARNNINVYI
jgi:hypothetical protein